MAHSSGYRRRGSFSNRRRSGTRRGIPHVLLGALLLTAGCACPVITIDKYFPRSAPAEAVRHFQLAMDLEMWDAAAGCLMSEQEEIGPWKLWAVCDVSIRELGGFSLRQIVSEVYWVAESGQVRGRPELAMVSVLSRPEPLTDQLYHLALRKKDGLWYIDLDATPECNIN